LRIFYQVEGMDRDFAGCYGRRYIKWVNGLKEVFLLAVVPSAVEFALFDFTYEADRIWSDSSSHPRGFQE
jgi:hypothetical protein